MKLRSLSFLLLFGLSAPAALAQTPGVRLTALAKDSARIEVRLDVPATVELEYGEELFAWEGRAESLEPAERHELALTKLLPNRTYFYRILVDGFDSGEVLTFRSGRSWIDRDAKILVTADTPSGASAETALGEQFFGEQANAVVALGGDGGDAVGFAALHARTLAETLVVETGGSGDVEALRTVAVSDIAIASVGENPLLLADGKPAPAASWLATALPAVEGACWSVVASAREIAPDSPEATALLDWARGAGVQVLMTRGETAALVEKDGVAWLTLSDPSDESERSIGRIVSAAGALIVSLEKAGGGLLGQAAMSRTCPLPASLTVDAGLDEDDPFGEGGSDIGGEAEDCDY